MKVDFTCYTNGKGHWTLKNKGVRILRIELASYHVNADGNPSGELRAYFSGRDWNNDIDDLIYTDPHWIEDFRGQLLRFVDIKYHSPSCDYSEHGMQGIDYVSMDVEGLFFEDNQILPQLLAELSFKRTVELEQKMKMLEDRITLIENGLEP
jgi:hypothetical protein